MTKFFEPINLSATHIYHSALELSPLSSIVRRLYYHQRYTPFPRVVTGTSDAWDRCIHIPGTYELTPYTWSPCGQFVATGTEQTIKIWDQLSSELLSTLAKPSAHFPHKLAYSPDGHSIASLSGCSLVIWDIQTGGIVKEINNITEIEYDDVNYCLLAWSLDGKTICTIIRPWSTGIYSVYIFNITSDTILSPGTLQSSDEPYLWAHNTNFWVMTIEQDDQAYTINISEVGHVLTKIESFHIRLWGHQDKIMSFSPTTHRISVGNLNQTWIWDIQISEYLLKVTKTFREHHFSSDGSLFTACSSSSIQVWKYTSGYYNLWKKLPFQDSSSWSISSLQFSPTLSSIVGHPKGILQVWHLDNTPNVTHSNSHRPLTVISCYGTYMASCYEGSSTINITNLHSQTPSQFIDIDMEIEVLALVGNVLSVLGCGRITAWLLTKEGVVDGIFGNRRAGHGDTIWTIPVPSSLEASVEGQIVIISEDHYYQVGPVCFAYHMETGEVLESTQVPKCGYPSDYSFWARRNKLYHPNHCKLIEDIPSKDDWLISQSTLQDGWVKDPKGRHRLWLPIEWRTDLDEVDWFYETTILRLVPWVGPIVIIMF